MLLQQSAIQQKVIIRRKNQIFEQSLIMVCIDLKVLHASTAKNIVGSEFRNAGQVYVLFFNSFQLKV